jgi:hypothetical protein
VTRRYTPDHRFWAKLGVLAVAGSVLACALAGAASGWNDSAGQVVPANHCVGSVCTIQGIRVRIQKVATWGAVPPGKSDAIWVAAQYGTANQNVGPNIVQAGYLKSDEVISNCAVGTGGSVKTFFYWINGNGTVKKCVIGQVVNTGETHTFKVQRCPPPIGFDTTSWCAYIDGTYISDQPIGLTQAYWSEVRGEYTCHLTCDNSSSYKLDALLGGTGSANFSVTGCDANCPSPTYSDVQSSNASTYDQTCGSFFWPSSTNNWVEGPVTPGSQWEIYSKPPMSC